MIIERVDLEEFEKGQEILREHLGSFFDQLEDGICLLAREDGAVLGAAYAPWDTERSREFLRHTFLQIDPGEALCAAGLAVLPTSRGRGIGRALLLEREREARASGYRYTLCQSWLQSPSPSYHLLRSIGMQEAAQLPGYWKKDYPLEGYCDLCGDFCFCTAILFYKKLDK